MGERVIFHCDCNSFYASVELLSYPELRDKPVAVAGSQDMRHGIILAKNEAAKKYKVQTAETIWSARKKCPELILLEPHHKKYSKYSKIINNIYAEYTDLVEPFGIDESWLDVTGSWRLFGSTPFEVAEILRNRVKEETQLTISIGISFNKIFAKLGSDLKKPDATTEIGIANYKEIVWPLPASDMLFVGRKTAETLRRLDINTIGDIACTDKQILTDIFGKMGAQLYTYANGLDDSPVAKIGEHEPVKSVGNGLTFSRDLTGYRDLHTACVSLADEVATRLRKHMLFAQSVQITIKDPQLKNITRQMQLAFATDLAKDIANAAMQLIRDNWDLRKPVRMLTITAQNLTDDAPATQTSFFMEAKNIDLKQQKLEKSLDKIREKYGWGSVLQGGLLHNDIGLYQHGMDDEDHENKDK